jgi:hypothetical protein
LRTQEVNDNRKIRKEKGKEKEKKKKRVLIKKKKLIKLVNSPATAPKPWKAKPQVHGLSK